MKVILTGVTGFIGGEILTQCLQDPTITSIIALSRRPLAEILMRNPKLSNLVIKDFSKYSSDVLENLKDADACIWTMGTTDAIREIEIDYPLVFATALAPKLSKPFRYIHCSGKLAEKDQAKSLWFFQEGRRVKGLAELKMMDVAKKQSHQGYWQTFIVRPAMVLPKTGGLLKQLTAPLVGSIKVDALAAAMVNIAQSGCSEQISENAQLTQRGRDALEAVQCRKWPFFVDHSMAHGLLL